MRSNVKKKEPNQAAQKARTKKRADRLVAEDPILQLIQSSSKATGTIAERFLAAAARREARIRMEAMS